MLIERRFENDRVVLEGYFLIMSLTEVLAELPSLSVRERQELVRRALELDETGLSPKNEALADRRLEEHHSNPTSSVTLDEMKDRLRSRFSK
jgi:putative addiction module component (TIGR02574 family)